ncbi:MAG: hypothetical protein WC959_03615 [Kiritimatiellales bacterium]
MQKTAKFIVWIMCLVALTGNTDPVKVLNHSFEIDEMTKPMLITPADWQYSGKDAAKGGRGLITKRDPQSHSIYGKIDKDQYAFLCGRKNSDSTDTSPNYLYQQIIGEKSSPIRLKTGDQLILTVALADARFGVQRFSFGLYSDPALTDALAILESKDITLSKQFTDYTLKWTVPAKYVGTPVYIGFSSYDVGTTASTPRLGIDNVRLEYKK